jgi:hypothetical protein
VQLSNACRNFLKGFLAAKPIFRRFIVAPAALMSNNVLVKLSSILMAALLMKQVFGFVIGPIKIFSDFNGHFHVYALSVYFNIYLHDFSVLSELVENLRKRRREANGNGTKKCPMGEHPKGQHESCYILYDTD